MDQRITSIFRKHFQGKPVVVASPGRINLIGEHTDYNDGFVLPAAIDRRIYLAIGFNETINHCRLYAADPGEAAGVDFEDIRPLAEPGWSNYVLGVAAELRKAGFDLQGFDVAFTGDIPIGGGLSSSAALENATAVGLNKLFSLGCRREELLHISQRAEHHYAGVRCGIMDQFASMMGRTGQAILLDCRSLDYEYVPLELGDCTLVLCDTNVSHSLAASEYNTRRRECEEALAALEADFPEATALRDIPSAGLEAGKQRLSPLLYRRARHVISENDRVHEAVQALQGGDLPALGELLYQSHDSLQHDYQVSCPELDFLVDQTRHKDYVLGARMMGGGFGGCTLNLVRKRHADSFVSEMKEAYQQEMDREMTAYQVGIGDGAKVLNP